MIRLACVLILTVFSLNLSAAENGNGQEPTGPNMPRNKGVYVQGQEIRKLYKAMQPHIQKARETYPEARKRFLAGLPDGHYFFVVTRLKDKSGVEEQVFISVSDIKNGVIQGYIYNKVQNVKGYTFRQLYSFPESEIVDWVITRPNGEQEGNYVGKFLENLK